MLFIFLLPVLTALWFDWVCFQIILGQKIKEKVIKTNNLEGTELVIESFTTASLPLKPKLLSRYTYCTGTVDSA